MKEKQNIEWKVSWQDDYLKWICAFANSQGGCLVVGKNDQGEVVGLANAEKLLEELPNKIRDLLGIMADVNLKSRDSKDYLEIDVDPYPSPINLRGRYYIRSGSTKQELRGAALSKFLLGKLGRNWDDMPVPYAAINDLDDSAFEYFKTAAAKSGRMDAEILNDTNKAIIDNLQLREGRYLRAAAILLFHKNPEQFVPGAYVKIGFFRNEHDLAYQDEVHGNLFAQAQKTLDLLTTKYMKAYIHYEGVRRIDKLLFPRTALREVLHNALVHRDYSSGIPIQIRVYEDTIRFYSSGCLPEGWTVKKLMKKHESAPHNPLIAGAFFRTGDIEAWGRGIDTIRTACREHGADFPAFESEPTSMMVEFWGQVPETQMPTEGLAENTGSTTQETTQETPVKVREKFGKGSGKSSGKILELLEQDGHLTIPQLAEQIGITPRAIEKNIKKLQEFGLLRRVGGRKEGHWEVLEGGTANGR